MAIRNLCLVALILLFAAGCHDSKDEVPPGPPPQQVEHPVQDVKPLVQATESIADPQRPPIDPLPVFQTVGAESGFEFERFDDVQGQRRIIEVNGGGVGLIDYDHDGWLDIFLTNGCRLPLSLNDQSHPSALFRTFPGMKFRSVAESALVQQFGHATGCAVGDFDNDGFDDLYVCTFRENILWMNNGDGTFTEATPEPLKVPGWSTSVAAADLNLDGVLDLYVVNYLVESDSEPRLCLNAAAPDGFEQCPPALFDGVDDVLLLGDGEGGFVDATESLGMRGLRGKGLGVVVSNLDDDDYPEIYVANDGQANFLFDAVVDDAGKLESYREIALAAGAALSESGFAQASMGVTSGDANGDGLSDLYMSHFYNDSNTLYENLGGLTLEDASRRSRLGPPSKRSLGFGTQFFDANADGWLDVMVTNGHIEDHSWMEHGEPFFQRPQLFLNEGQGKFAESSHWAGEYFQQERMGRGLAIGDLDHDGRLDVVCANQFGPSAILRNITDGARLQIVRVIGRTANRSGIGTQFRCESKPGCKIRELTGGGSFQSANAHHAALSGSIDEWTIHNLAAGSSPQYDVWMLPDGQVAVLERR
ncbi:MAG: VCBS repeat-containing protein [Planctomycetaceae bacterium]|nr:VCBS repeat-containing protein [Planctomycetaceae bacterium]